MNSGYSSNDIHYNPTPYQFIIRLTSSSNDIFSTSMYIGSQNQVIYFFFDTLYSPYLLIPESYSSCYSISSNGDYQFRCSSTYFHSTAHVSAIGNFSGYSTPNGKIYGTLSFDYISPTSNNVTNRTWAGFIQISSLTDYLGKTTNSKTGFSGNQTVGTFGLGYANMSSKWASYFTSYIDYLYSNRIITRKMFTFNTGVSSPQLLIGGYDGELVIQKGGNNATDIKWFAGNEGDNYQFTVSVDRIQVQKKNISVSQYQTKAYFDINSKGYSFDYYTYLSIQQTFNSYSVCNIQNIATQNSKLKQLYLKSTTNSSKNVNYTELLTSNILPIRCQCGTINDKTLPQLIFVLKKYYFNISAANFMTYNSNYGICEANIYYSASYSMILGRSFFDNYQPIFDIDKQKVGFVVNRLNTSSFPSLKNAYSNSSSLTIILAIVIPVAVIGIIIGIIIYCCCCKKKVTPNQNATQYTKQVQEHNVSQIDLSQQTQNQNMVNFNPQPILAQQPQIYQPYQPVYIVDTSATQMPGMQMNQMQPQVIIMNDPNFLAQQPQLMMPTQNFYQQPGVLQPDMMYQNQMMMMQPPLPQQQIGLPPSQQPSDPQNAKSQ